MSQVRVFVRIKMIAYWYESSWMLVQVSKLIVTYATLILMSTPTPTLTMTLIITS